jgi:hypothetical protein
MTWNTLKQYAIGEILTANEWNTYVGANTNIRYLYNAFNSLNSTSFFTRTRVLSGVTTTMNMGASTSFAIFSSWGSGLYFIPVSIQAESTENLSSFRTVRLTVNNVEQVVNHKFPSTLQNGSVYDLFYTGKLNAGDIIRINFYQGSGAPSSFMLAAEIKKVGV